MNMCMYIQYIPTFPVASFISLLWAWPCLLYFIRLHAMIIMIDRKDIWDDTNNRSGNTTMSINTQLKKRAKELKSNIPAVFLALKDARTPFLAKILAAIAIAYALSPIDLIPDFIPVLGYLDDVLLLPILVAATIQLIPKTVWDDCKKQSAGLWANGKPKKWYYALPIVLLWLLLIWLIVKAIWL